jgi:hypothetical protein
MPGGFLSLVLMRGIPGLGGDVFNSSAGDFMARRTQLLATLAIALLAAPTLGQSQLKNPIDWTWRLDTPAKLVTALDVAGDSWLFATMPPGWHVTTGPGALLVPSTVQDIGQNFSLEAQIFLFPGTSQDEYGLLIGGRGIDGQEPVEYTALVIRRDGQAAVLRRSRDRAEAVAAWRPHEAVVAHKGGKDPVKNVIRADVDPTTVSLSVNGLKVIEVARADVDTSGRVGFRIGKDLNLHITSLDVTQRLAPVPIRKQTP